MSTPAEALYDESYFTGREYADYLESAPVHRRNFERKLRILTANGLLPRDGLRVLEIGCATGEFGALVLELPDQAIPPQYLGLEVSEYCRKLAHHRGLRVYSPLDPQALEAVRALKPNAVVAWDVWEHLPDPIETLEGLLQCADPMTMIALTTVDTGSWIPKLRQERWRQYHPPTHLNFPTRKSFQIYFSHRKLDIMYHRSFGYTRSLAEYIRPLRTRLSGRVSEWTDWRWLYTVPLYLNLFDTQMVVARRKA